jgi:ABC-2 type transport system ATP-binding protein
MEDVAALCPRIIVIDRGHIVWDGPLQQLVHKLQPEKRITLKLGAQVARTDLESSGARLVSLEGVEARLQVGQDSLSAAISALLAKVPVLDFTVEDPPLEEVLGELFGKGEA